MESTPPRRRRAAPRHRLQITDRDRRMLAFAAEHRFVVAGQLAVVLEVTEATADARLRALGRAGYFRRERKLNGEPASHQITRDGLKAIGSDLPSPRALDLAAYRHDLGLGWLMVAARRGRFGPLQAVVSERRMRSDDGRAADGGRADDGGRTGGGGRTDRGQRHGVRLGGTGPGGRDRLHYPDMVIVTETGHRVAFELELTPKPPARLEGILAAYGADRRIDMVIYLVDRRSVREGLERARARVGLRDLVRIQDVTVDAEPRPVGDESGRDRRHVRGRPEREPGRGSRPSGRAEAAGR